MQLLIADDNTIFFFITSSYLALKKLKEQPPSKVAQKISNTLFSLLPKLPKQPKQKNSRSKMWLINQLYIKLGFNK